MNLELYLPQFEAYTEGTLSPGEREAFDQELASNPEFKEAFSLYQVSLHVMEQQIEDTLRATLKDWEKIHSGADSARTEARIVSFRARLVRYSAAAAVLLLFGVFGLSLVSRNYGNQSLYARYYDDPALGGLRGDPSAPAAGLLEEAKEAYQNQDFALAADKLRAVPQTDPQYPEALYYLGHTYSQTGQYAEAQQAFSQAASAGDSRFSEKSEWYAALSCLRAGEDDAACQDLFDRMAANPDHSFHHQAKEMVRQLGSFWRKISGVFR